MKHTQGEWKVTGLEIRQKKTGLILANVYKHLEVNQSEEESKANAKIMGASPDLLNALILARKQLLISGVTYDLADLYNNINGAIQKATQ